MKDHSDEELQQSIENNLSIDNSVDARAYKKVFDALRKDPYQLPAGFADRVIQKIEVRKPEFSKEYIWFGLGISLFVIATAITLVWTKLTIDLSAFRFLSGYVGLFVFGAVAIFVIQYLDKTLVKNKLTNG
jgi:hypothetical protein